MRLRNKVALITGGNSGIGLATAKLFVAEGAKVAITGRNQQTLDAAALELGSEALGMKTDVTDLGEMEKTISATVERIGNLDGRFANARPRHFTPVCGTAVESV